MTALVYKRPESVLVVVYSLPGEVLLLERNQPQGFWQSVTGSLEWGESASAAAIRELREETGLAAAGRLLDGRRLGCYPRRFPIIPPWQARYAPGVTHNLEHCFYLPLPSRRLIRLAASEHLRHRWLNIRRAAERASSWTNRKAIEALL